MRASSTHSSLSRFLADIGRPAALNGRRAENAQLSAFQSLVEGSTKAGNETPVPTPAPAVPSATKDSTALSWPQIPMLDAKVSRTETSEPSGDSPAEKGLRTVAEVAAAAARDWGLTENDVKLSYREEYVWFPLGGWFNRFVVADCADGRRFEFSSDLAATHPDFTATELNVLMRERINPQWL